MRRTNYIICIPLMAFCLWSVGSSPAFAEEEAKKDPASLEEEVLGESISGFTVPKIFQSDPTSAPPAGVEPPLPVEAEAEPLPFVEVEAELPLPPPPPVPSPFPAPPVDTEHEELRHEIDKLSRLVNVSGYADAEYHLTGEKGRSNEFRIHHFSLFFTKDIQKDWKFFSEIEFEDAVKIESGTAADPNNSTVKTAQGTFFVEQMYIEYHPNPEWNLSFGRFATPWGIWGIYHYPPYVPTQRPPLTYKVVFPEVSDGVRFRKIFDFSNRKYDTNFYYVNGAGNPGSGDRNQSKGMGFRIDTDLTGIVDTRGLSESSYLSFLSEGFSAGGSLFRETDNQKIKRTALALHTQAQIDKDTQFQAEFTFRKNTPEGTADPYTDMGYYFQVTNDQDKWTFAGRYDTYDPDRSIKKNGHSRFTLAGNYHFAHNVVGKAEIHKNFFGDPVKLGFFEIVLSIVVSIGDL